MSKTDAPVENAIGSSMAQTRPGRGRATRCSENPLLSKELRGQMRGKRTFVILSVYLVVLTGLTALLSVMTTVSSSDPTSGPRMADLGQGVFYGVTILELLMVAFVTPAFSAGAISGERERRTFDLLRTTLLAPRQIVVGKLVAALSTMILLIFVSLPVQSLAFVFGGADPIELALAALILLVAALTYAAVGLFYSTVSRSTLVATVLTYVTVFVATVGLPVLVLLVAGFGMTPLMLADGGGQVSWVGEAALLYGGLLFISLSPLGTAIVAELIYLQDGSVLLTWQSLSGEVGQRIPVPSPWIVFLVLYLTIAAVALGGATRRVGRQETA